MILDHPPPQKNIFSPPKKNWQAEKNQLPNKKIIFENL